MTFGVLVSRLSGVQRLIVRPTSSALPFTEENPLVAGNKLGVDFVLDGNIRRVAQRIRVAVQLLNVGENSTYWAARFDEDAMDVLALEDSISERVTKRLLPHLTGEERQQLARRGTNNAEAHEAYLRGRFFWSQFTPEALAKASKLFEKAVALDPEYALAYAGIADFYTWATIFGLFPPTESSPKVFAAASRAIEIDATLAEGYAAVGLYYSNICKWAEGEKNYRRALEINPHYSLAHEWLSSMLVGTGRFDEGVKEIKMSEQLDPLSLRTKTLTAWTLYQARQFDECAAKGREIIELDGDFSQGHFQIGNALLELGQADEAVESCRKALALMPDSPVPIYPLCFALVAVGKVSEANEHLTTLKNMAAKMYVPPYFLALTHLAVGEIDTAFEFFEQAIAECSPWIMWFGTEAKLDVIRQDPRYLKLLRSTNNPIEIFPK
ncbi:MAG: tetratricopeptide repeat protein [Acidobacteriota bacterium]|nr:tetratricopeptide repeat protein [Acidobacteriota bacterium]